MGSVRWTCWLLVLFVCIVQSCAEIKINIPGLLRDLTKEFLERVHLDEEPYCKPDPDICRNASELITSKGYPCEEHTVQTEDGFLLGMQRIPHGRQRVNSNSLRPIVFLQHGLLSSSTCWITNLANESLGFILADAGYDVWLGNVRGNTYSRRHTRLNPDQAEFWAWSWDEMTQWDIPAMLHYAMKTSGQSKMYYIGHSQGTLVAMTRFSEDKELRDKVKLFIGLGPVATVGHIEGAFKLLSEFLREFEDLFSLLGVKEFLPNSLLIKMLASTMCHEKYTKSICENILFLIAGVDVQNFNSSRLPVYLGHTPAGTSVQNVIHFGQMVRSRECQKYDYGSKEKNMEHYNTPYPPYYNLGKMTVPSYLFSSDKDTLADPQDVRLLLSMLPNVKYHREIKGWNHLDFIWAVDSATELYHQLIQILRQNPI